MKKHLFNLFFSFAIVSTFSFSLQAAQVNLTKVGEYPFANTRYLGQLGIYHENSMLYVGRNGIESGEGAYLDIFDVSDMGNISRLSSLKITSHFEGTISSIAKYGDYLLTGDHCYSTSVVDVSDPSAPVVLDTIGFSRAGLAVSAYDENYYFVGLGLGTSGNLVSVNWSDPSNLTAAYTSSTLPESGRQFQVQGNYLYSVWNNGTKNFIIFDVSNPASPTEVGSLSLTDSHVNALTVDGDYAYLSGQETGLIVVDISDSANPFVAGSYSIPESNWDIEKSGNFVFLMTLLNKIYVIDVSDPSASILDNILTLDGASFTGLEISDDGQFLFVLDGHGDILGEESLLVYQIITCSDCDGDGMPDQWEIDNFGDTTTASGAEDSDGDGLTDIEEYTNGTNPNLKDTDKDGMSDGYEVNTNGTDPATPDGLIAFYPFEGNANDASENGNDGTVSGAMLTNDRQGIADSAYEFDGVDDQVAITSVSTLRSNEAKSIFAWVYMPDGISDAGYGSLRSVVDDSPASHWRSLNLFVDGDQYIPRFITQSSGGVYLEGEPITHNQWHQIGFTWSPGEAIRLYVDGELAKTSKAISSWDTYPGAAYIGRQYQNPTGHWFLGKIDDVRIFNRSLSDGEVREIFLTENDADNDHMPDTWETKNFGNTERDGYGDFDGDGLTDREEWDINTDPKATDSDFDGLNDSDEQTYGTDPNNHDTDQDGLSDGFEVNTNGSDATTAEGLLAYYPYNGSANDESGNGYSGTVNGAILTLDRFEDPESAFRFDGLDDYISLGDIDALDPSSGENFTVSTWFRTSGGFTKLDQGMILNDYDPNSGGFKLSAYNDGSILFIIRDTSSYTVEASENVTDGKWHHAVGIRDGTQMQLYLDGSLVGSASCEGGPMSNNYPFVIGAFSFDYTYNFNGSVDDVRYYNRALSDTEIQELYNTESAHFNDGLLAYYPFNGNAIDESGNGRDGTVNGAILTSDRNEVVGNAYQFDGIDDSISVSLPDITSISFWYKSSVPITQSSQDFAIIGGPDSGWLALGSVTYDMSTEIVSISAESGGYYYWNESVVGAIDTNWHHYVLTWDEANDIYHLYIDGNSIGLANKKATPVGKLLGGDRQFSDPSWAPLNGILDDIHIFDRSLSAYEVQQLSQIGAPTNDPPVVPASPIPAANATDVSVDTELSWSGGDPDTGDTVVYDVYFGTDSTPSNLVSSGQVALVYDPGTLIQGTTYYWKIVARDLSGEVTQGPVWSFSTSDTMPPVITSFSVEDISTQSDQITNEATVNVTLNGTDDSGSIYRWLITETSATPSATDMEVGSAFAPTTYTILTSGDGLKTLYAWAMDAANNISASAQWTIKLDTAADFTAAASSTCTMQDNVTVSGTREDGLTVSVSCADSGATIGTASYPDAASWQVVVSGLSEGTHTITIEGSDAAGNTGSDSIDVRVSIPTSATVDTGDGSLLADGSSILSVTVTVLDGLSQPVCVGTTIDMTTTLGIITPGSYTTDSGQFSCNMTASTDLGTATVTASFSGSSLGSSNIEMVAGDIDRLVFTDIFGTPIIQELPLKQDAQTPYLKVQTQDAHGHPVQVGENTSVILATTANSGDGEFYHDSIWEPDQAEIEIASGSSIETFRYRSSGLGLQTLSAIDLNLVLATGTMAVNVLSDDDLPPITTADPAGGDYNTGQQVELPCTDEGGSSCAGTYFTLDGTDPKSSGTARTYTGPIAINANTVLQFYSVDDASTPNVEDVKREDYTIDTVAPGLSINTPTDGAGLEQLWEVNGTAFDTGSGLSGVDLQITDGTYYLNSSNQWVTSSASWVGALSSDDWSTWAFNTSTTNWQINRAYTITARAMDDAGNQTTVQHSFTYQPTEPSAISCNLSANELILGESLSIAGLITPQPQQSGRAVDIVLTPDGGQPIPRTVLTNSAGEYFYPDNSEHVCNDIYRAGTWSAVASWTGDDQLEGSTSQEQTFVVQKAQTTTTLSSSSQSVKINGTLTISGKVTPQPDCGRDLSGLQVVLTITPPTGEATTIGIPNEQGSMDSSGRFVLSDYPLTLVGDYTVKAKFFGNDAYLVSESEASTISVVENAGYAIIVQGRTQSGEGLNEHGKTTDFVYEAFAERGLTAEDIRYFNYAYDDSDPEIRPDVYGLPSKTALQDAITNWASTQMQAGSANLSIVLVNHGQENNFYLNNEILSPTELAEWIGTLEDSLAGTAAEGQEIVVVLGFCNSGSFIDELSMFDEVNDKKRVIIASAASDEYSHRDKSADAQGLRHGEYFVYQLFAAAKIGVNVKECFQTATDETERWIKFNNQDYNSSDNVLRSKANASRYKYSDYAKQHPLLDDDGDGEGSNHLKKNSGDGQLAKELFFGINTIDVNPAELLVTRVAPTRFVPVGGSGAHLWAEVASSANLSNIWLEVQNPNQEEIAGDFGQVYMELDSYTLFQSVPLKYEYSTNSGTSFVNVPGFDTPGMYTIYYLTSDTDGEVSPFTLGTVYRQSSTNLNPPDGFDLLSPSDGAEKSTKVILDWEDTTDPDGDGLTYTVLLAEDPAALDTPYADGVEIVRKELVIPSTCLLNEADGIKDLRTYYWKVQAIDRYGSITNSTSTWSFSTNNANPFYTPFDGYVATGSAYEPVQNAAVTVADKALLTGSTGYYLGELDLPPDTYDVTVEAAGYLSQTKSIDLMTDAEIQQINFLLVPVDKGDIDRFEGVTLGDAIVAMKVLSGFDVSNQIRENYATVDVDVNGNTSIEMEEAIYILQHIAGMRIQQQ